MFQRTVDIQSMTKEQRQELMDFLEEIKVHPQFENFLGIMEQRGANILDQVLNNPAEMPYERGYVMGCYHSSRLNTDIVDQTLLQFQKEAVEAEEADNGDTNNDETDSE